MAYPWSAGEILNASDLNKIVKFGGDGSDGALNVTSGTTNIDASGASIVVKNYTSINISSGAILGLTSPAAGGTILVLKSQGDVTIAGTVELTGDGAAAGTVGTGILDDAGTEGNDGHGGADDAKGGTGSTRYSIRTLYSTVSVGKTYTKTLILGCGCGGGTGGLGESGGAGGAGGRGGGVLIVECFGSLNFSGEININGDTGTVGANGGGGGGGGSAGMALVLYKSLTANTGTINAKGGAGGRGGIQGAGGFGQTGGGGGEGGASYTEAGKDGGDGGSGSLPAPTNGTNTTTASGAGGGGGESDHPSSPDPGSGGTQGATDSNHYLVVENTEFA